MEKIPAICYEMKWSNKEKYVIFVLKIKQKMKNEGQSNKCDIKKEGKIDYVKNNDEI